MRKGKPALRGPLLHDEDFTIVAKYGSEFRGFVQYYLLAQDVFRLELLRWVMETSMLKTLAGKYKSTVTKMARRYKAAVDTPDGQRMRLQVTVQRDKGKKPLVARFGGIPLKRQRTAVITDRNPVMATARRNELTTSCSPGSAICARDVKDCKSTTSASLPISTSKDGRNGRRGCT